ncbi:MAG: DUF45 domain-containing protein [Clostridia bacterium]|nr:DUF45 domain-containing protein [Clostridia bacterium]
MKIEVIRQRRKTVSIKLENSQMAIMKVPISCSENKIKEFLQSKKSWIEKMVEKLEAKENFSENFDLINNAYLFGKCVGTVENVLKNCNLERNLKFKTIKQFYCSKFFQLQDMCKDLSLQTGLKFREMKQTNSKHIWGSFSSDGIMKLNWKLVLIPKKLIVYVILHELCHSLQMNHSAKFWGLVNSVCPDFKECKRELSNFSFVLKSDFL